MAVKQTTIFLAISASCYAQDCCEKPPSAYNYPATLEINCSENLSARVSFNYWQPIQENMELGQFHKSTVTAITLGGLTTSSVTTSNSSKMIPMDFDFKPGFTVALGYLFECDDWKLTAEYTWFHSTHKKSATANRFVFFNASTEHISPRWGIFTNSQKNVKYAFASEKWKLDMDLIDLDLGRGYYVGCDLTFNPRVGVRGAFIKQNAEVSYNNGFVDFSVNVPGLLGSGTLVENKNVSNVSHSWAVGPKFALETNWILGCGFSLFGNGEVDLLFTRYTSLKEKAVTTGTVAGIIDLIPFSFNISDTAKNKQKNVDTLRTHLELELGVGWGTYCCCNCAYASLTAGYKFQVFFDQNMFRFDLTNPGSDAPNGNLYIQGLIVSLEFDF